MNDDAQHLEQYVRDGSEPAFRKLVERYIALVNSTAWRMTGGNVTLAQDVTQLVFTDLARKAASLPRGTILGGWLHRHTCYTALKALRTENRRQKRERIAMEINAINDNSGQDAHWLELAPVLDEALNSLGTRDREVIVLRYLQQQDMRSIGENLGASETAAQKRLGRALEKLRSLLTRRGVTLASATVLGSSLEAGVVTSVPTELVATVSTTAVGSATAVSTGLTLLTLKTMITTKMALGLAAAVVIVSATSAIFIINSGNSSAPVAVAKAPAPAAPVSPLPPQIVAAPKVEAPKLAPAPAGNAPVGPNDLAAARANSSNSGQTGGFTFSARASNVTSGTLMLNGRSTGSGGASPGNGMSLPLLKASLENFKRQTAAIIAQRTQEANGDPDKLAKVEAAQQQYEQYAEDKQKQIDALEVQAATGEQNTPAPTNP